MKRILVVTSKRLEEAVRRAAKPPEGYEVEVWGLPVDVVALLRPNSLKQLLKLEADKRKVSLSSYDYVLVSGAIPGNLKPLEEELGTKIYKGTRTLNDFEIMIKNIDKLEKYLSPEIPLEETLERFKLMEIKSFLELSPKEYLTVGELKLPVRPPPALVFAEVLDDEDVEEQLLRASEVADAVIVGSTSLEPDPQKARRLVKLARRYFNTVGFDSMFVSELKSSEADLLMSLDAGKVEEFKGFGDTAFVVVPGDSKRGSWPLKAEEKVESLLRNLKMAKEAGLEKLIADPILSPFPHTLESFVALREVSRKVNVPIMVGLSNVVELTDADSPGLVAGLASLAIEGGASALMVTEHSPKCRGAWAEAKVSAIMASYALHKSTLPKDLGLDLLILKEKRVRREKYEVKGKKRIEVKDYQFKLENAVVRIWVEGDEVRALVEPQGVWLSGDPYLMGKTLIARGIIKEPSHALYLGWELHKAHLAAKLGKSYVQEEELKFETPKEKLRKIEGVKAGEG